MKLALVNRGNHEEIMAYITEHWFDIEAFNAFIKRGKLNEVRHYLSCKQIVYDGCWEQIVALGTGVLNEVVDYILEQHRYYKNYKDEASFLSKWDDVMILVVKSSDHCAIRRLITQTKLGRSSLSYLCENGNAEDNLVYELCWGDLHRQD